MDAKRKGDLREAGKKRLEEFRQKRQQQQKETVATKHDKHDTEDAQAKVETSEESLEHSEEQVAVARALPQEQQVHIDVQPTQGAENPTTMLELQQHLEGCMSAKLDLEATVKALHDSSKASEQDRIEAETYGRHLEEQNMSFQQEIEVLTAERGRSEEEHKRVAQELGKKLEAEKQAVATLKRDIESREGQHAEALLALEEKLRALEASYQGEIGNLRASLGGLELEKERLHAELRKTQDQQAALMQDEARKVKEDMTEKLLSRLRAMESDSGEAGYLEVFELLDRAFQKKAEELAGLRTQINAEVQGKNLLSTEIRDMKQEKEMQEQQHAKAVLALESRLQEESERSRMSLDDVEAENEKLLKEVLMLRSRLSEEANIRERDVGALVGESRRLVSRLCDSVERSDCEVYVVDCAFLPQAVREDFEEIENMFRKKSTEAACHIENIRKLEALAEEKEADRLGLLQEVQTLKDLNSLATIEKEEFSNKFGDVEAVNTELSNRLHQMSGILRDTEASLLSSEKAKLDLQKIVDKLQDAERESCSQKEELRSEAERAKRDSIEQQERLATLSVQVEELEQRLLLEKEERRKGAEGVVQSESGVTAVREISRKEQERLLEGLGNLELTVLSQKQRLFRRLEHLESEAVSFLDKTGFVFHNVLEDDFLQKTFLCLEQEVSELKKFLEEERAASATKDSVMKQKEEEASLCIDQLRSELEQARMRLSATEENLRSSTEELIHQRAAWATSDSVMKQKEEEASLYVDQLRSELEQARMRISATEETLRSSTEELIHQRDTMVQKISLLEETDAERKSMVHVLQQKVATTEAEIARATDCIDILRPLGALEKVSWLVKAWQELKSLNGEASAKVQELDEQLRSRNQENCELLKLVEKLNVQRQEEFRHLMCVVEKISTLFPAQKVEVTTIENENTMMQLESTVDTLLSNLTALRYEDEELRKNQNLCVTKIHELDEQLRLRNQESNELAKLVDTQRQEFRQLMRVVEKVSSFLPAQEVEMTTNENAVMQLESWVNILLSNFATLRYEDEELRKRVARAASVQIELQERLAQKDAELLNREDKLKSSSVQLNQVSEDYSACQKKLELAVQERDSMRLELADLEQKTSTVREKLGLAVKKGKGLAQQRDELKQILADKCAKMDDLQEQMHALEKDLKEVKVQKAELEENCGELLNKTQYLSVELERARTSLRNVSEGKQLVEEAGKERWMRLNDELQTKRDSESRLLDALRSAEAKAEALQRDSDGFASSILSLNGLHDMITENIKQKIARFVDLEILLSKMVEHIKGSPSSDRLIDPQLLLATIEPAKENNKFSAGVFKEKLDSIRNRLELEHSIFLRMASSSTELLDNAVHDLEALDSTAFGLQGIIMKLEATEQEVSSLQEQLSYRIEELSTTRNSLDAAQLEAASLANKLEELELAAIESHATMGSMELLRSKAANRLASTVKRLSELQQLSERLLSEVEKLHAELGESNAEKTRLQAEAEVHRSEIEEKTSILDHVHNNLKSILGTDDERVEPRALIELVISHFQRLSWENDNLLTTLRNKDVQLRDMKQMLDETEAVTSADFSSKKVSSTTEIEQVPLQEHLKLKPVHLRSQKKTSVPDHVVVELDLEGAPEEVEDKGHAFKPLAFTLPRSFQSLSTKVDTLCLFAANALKRQPIMRLSLAAYWVGIHLWIVALLTIGRV